MSFPEILPLTKIQKYANNDLFVNVVSGIKSANSALWLKVGGDEEPSVVPTHDISNKTACYLSALQNLGITQNYIGEMEEFETAPCPPDTFN